MQAYTSLIYLVHLSYTINVITIYTTTNPYFFLLKTNIIMFLIFLVMKIIKKLIKKILQKKRKKRSTIFSIFLNFEKFMT